MEHVKHGRRTDRLEIHQTPDASEVRGSPFFCQRAVDTGGGNQPAPMVIVRIPTDGAAVGRPPGSLTETDEKSVVQATRPRIICAPRERVTSNVTRKGVSDGTFAGNLLADRDEQVRQPNGHITALLTALRNSDGKSDGISGLLESVGPNELVEHPDCRQVMDTIAHNGFIDIALAVAEHDKASAVELITAAARHGRPDLLRALIAQGAAISLFAIHAAARHGNLEIVRLLLKHGPPPGSTIVAVAAGNGQLAIVQELLNHGVRIDTEALKQAASRHCRQIVSLLLLNNAPAHNRIFSHLAADPEAIRILLDFGLRATGDDLARAIMGNHFETTRLMLASGLVSGVPAARQAMSDAVRHAATHSRIKMLQLLKQNNISVIPEIEAAAARIKSPSFRKDFQERIMRGLARTDCTRSAVLMSV